MPNSYAILEHQVHRFALAIAVVVAFAVPVGYYLVAYGNYSDELNFKAKVKASALNALVASNPETWMFAENRIQGLLFHEPVPLDAELVQVIDKDNVVVTQVGKLPRTPALKRDFALYDGEREVGKVVISATMRTLIWATLANTILGMLVGALIFAVMKVLPLRALRVATDALRTSERRFRSLFEHLPNVAVQGYDSERRVIYWNLASERLYG